MAKSNKEKAALWAIHGYYKDERQAIEKIYELDAKSEHLNYLLTRLVNKQERDINNSFQVTKDNSGAARDYNAQLSNKPLRRIKKKIKLRLRKRPLI